MSDDELPVPESKIVGAHVYDDALFTEDAETPVNVMTGETPEHSKATVEDAQYFAAELSDDKPYVATPASVETQIETQSKPYTGCVFHHFSIVGGMEMHKAFDYVWNSPEYDVNVDADYETGVLTITVERL